METVDTAIGMVIGHSISSKIISYRRKWESIRIIKTVSYRRKLKLIGAAEFHQKPLAR